MYISACTRRSLTHHMAYLSCVHAHHRLFQGAETFQKTAYGSSWHVLHEDAIRVTQIDQVRVLESACPSPRHGHLRLSSVRSVPRYRTIFLWFNPRIIDISCSSNICNRAQYYYKRRSLKDSSAPKYDECAHQILFGYFVGV